MPAPTPPDDTGAEQAAIIADLALEVEHLAHTVAGLTAAPTGRLSASSDLPPPPHPWCWPRMPHTKKADRLGELGDWMTQVLFTWPSAQRAVLPCWPRHWDVVEELSMLYCCWRTAYLWEGATAGDTAEYLDRWLPNAIARIEVRLRPCGQGHHPDGKRRDDTATLTPVQDELRWL
ncbi:hypothetical protein B0I32_1455 [Nonomuraea fuscirosea]|uniref:DUF4913 domain-containing protein n=1 Tax=Nonomuraea fuscirosea TaxID=1291556 RepID=A0A2T0LRW8_9ACTN|nr:hypothetical protein [Nonomuraea fuscirosea]PRX46316.1 hypothetical protein B0I32_1455 [Nonomuraea fuscirosea]